MTQIVATFYKFVRLWELTEMQQQLHSFCQEQGVRGTILLASEGINGTIAGVRDNIDAVLAQLRSQPGLGDLEAKESAASTPPFHRLKVRIKREIVSLGLPEANPNQQVGTYVKPQDWNALIADPTVTVVDTRNAYEVAIGTFQNAQNPQTRSFRQFPDYVRTQLNPAQHPKVALFCTGGIRCEKATALMLSRGFREVYHLQGGILRYLTEIPAQESLWQGECFVFDDRVALKQGLEPGTHEMCRACGRPVSLADRASPSYQEGIRCPYCDRAAEEEE